jgi:hypothetical protein
MNDKTLFLLRLGENPSNLSEVGFPNQDFGTLI